jgi:putative transposase
VHKPRRRGTGQRKGFTETDYARLFDAAHQPLAGPLVVVWDNSSTQTSAAMTELVTARDWLTIVQMSPYAHELNPVELVWAHLKGPWPTWPNATSPSSPRWSRPGCGGCSTGLLSGFLASTGLDLTPFSNTHD